MSQYPFRRLQTELASLIASLPAESRLPSEPELARRMGASRATLREAMRSFEGQGLIRRRQGVGTFVVAKVPVMDSGLEVLESIESLAARTSLPVRMGELQVREVSAGDGSAAALEVPEGTPLTQVERVIYTDNRPIAYLVDTLPVDVLAAAELQTGFTGSVLDLLLRRGDPKLTQSRTDIRAIGATSEVARALQIQRDDVLLHFVAQLYAKDGRVVDYSFSYFLPGYFHFHVVRRVGKT
ncbi:MAG: GntR family transcriptional regulator [Anaerolineaceae bacterium]|nr:MAG: GntR family transcriptional regulator [Anaerolineaceae bacterium]